MGEIVGPACEQLRTDELLMKAGRLAVSGARNVLAGVVWGVAYGVRFGIEATREGVHAARRDMDAIEDFVNDPASHPDIP